MVRRETTLLLTPDRELTAPERRRRNRRREAQAALLLLSLERRALNGLRAALRLPLRLASIGATAAAAHLVEAQVEASARLALFAVRSAARAAASARFPFPAPTRPAALSGDAAGVERATVGLGRGWRGEYEAARLDGAGELAAQRIATERLAGHYAERTALTETSLALNDETARQARALEAATGSGVVLRWSAVLDRRTCSTCESLDGEERPASEGFDEGPPAHVSCRCFVFVV